MSFAIHQFIKKYVPLAVHTKCYLLEKGSSTINKAIENTDQLAAINCHIPADYRLSFSFLLFFP